MTVDLREEVREVPHQTNITKDNASIGIDFLIYWQVVEAVKSVLEVGNWRQAALGIATTTLRAVIGDIVLDDVLAQREHINQVLRTKLDETTERWGVKVTAVEIREIVPPREIQDAMTRQMSAERTRRAVVTEAQGTREAVHHGGRRREAGGDPDSRRQEAGGHSGSGRPARGAGAGGRRFRRGAG